MAELISCSPEETGELGARLAELLQPGDFVALYGDLGAGKTRFAQGVARGLGVADSTPVTSPTYTLLNCYSGRLPLYHFDLYRISSDDEASDAGFDEYFGGNGVSLVEWPQRLHRLLPEERLEVCFTWLDEQLRRLEFRPFGARFARIAGILVGAAEKL